jgi:hypothetical protein
MHQPMIRSRALNGVEKMSNDPPENGTPSNRVDALGDPVVSQILQTLRGMRFGVVSIVVQDGVVVQIERTEKVRLRRQDGA